MLNEHNEEKATEESAANVEKVEGIWNESKWDDGSVYAE